MAGVQAVKRIKRTVYVWLCACQSDRCRHVWESTGPQPPRRCAKCNRLNWQQPARAWTRRKHLKK